MHSASLYSIAISGTVVGKSHIEDSRGAGLEMGIGAGLGDDAVVDSGTDAAVGCGDGGTAVGGASACRDVMVCRMFLQTIWHPL